MNLEDYRAFFIGSALVLILVAAFPGLTVIFPLSIGTQRFSELWVLSPDHMAWDYPFNVKIGEKSQIFVGVGNNLGRSAYYVLYAKLRNQTQEAPNFTTAIPSPLVALSEFRIVLGDGGVWEKTVAFSIFEASRLGNSAVIAGIQINEVNFKVDCISMWDPSNRGFYCQLFFELWIYDSVSSSFQYSNRFVGVWLNMTL